MGKEVVVIKESPGFITSRINAMIGNEAFYMLQEGIASAADIDKALKLGLNHPMGPFELVDLSGSTLGSAFSSICTNRWEKNIGPAPLLVQYVKAGGWADKSGRGVYESAEARPLFRHAISRGKTMRKKLRGTKQSLFSCHWVRALGIANSFSMAEKRISQSSPASWSHPMRSRLPSYPRLPIGYPFRHSMAAAGSSRLSPLSCSRRRPWHCRSTL